MYRNKLTWFSFTVLCVPLAIKHRRAKQTKKRNQDPKRKLKQFIYQRRYKREWFTKKNGKRPSLENKFPNFPKGYFLYLKPTLLKKLKTDFVNDLATNLCNKTVGTENRFSFYEHQLGSSMGLKSIKTWIVEVTTALCNKFSAEEYKDEHVVWQHICERINVFVESCGIAFSNMGDVEICEQRVPILEANEKCNKIHLQAPMKTTESEIAQWETIFDRELLLQVNVKRDKLKLPRATYIDGELINCFSSS